MLTVFWTTIKDRKVSLIIYSLAATLFVWMYVAMFPAIQEQSAVWIAALESFPEALFEAFGIEDFNMSTIERFLAIEHFSLVWPIMAILLLVSIAGRGLAGQIEQGTAELLLSRPVSRLRIFGAKYLVGVFALVVFAFVSVFSVVPLAALHGVDYIFGNHVSVAVIAVLFGWAVFSMAILFSALFAERSRVYMATGGVLLVMYVLNIAAAMKEDWDSLKFASFFHYYDYNDALIRNTLDATDVLVFAAVALGCTLVGAWWFSRRDVAV